MIPNIEWHDKNKKKMISCFSQIKANITEEIVHKQIVKYSKALKADLDDVM